MTREEIKHASKDYVNYLLDKQEYHNEKYTEHDIKQAFEKGAEWADTHPKNVWHDASEEPQYKNKRILAYSEYFDYFFVDFPSYLMIKDGGQFKNWETVVLRNKISKWAYISDLFPKGGEQ